MSKPKKIHEMDRAELREELTYMPRVRRAGKVLLRVSAVFAVVGFGLTVLNDPEDAESQDPMSFESTLDAAAMPMMVGGAVNGAAAGFLIDSANRRTRKIEGLLAEETSSDEVPSSDIIA